MSDEDNITIASFDIGKKNFAFYIEEINLNDEPIFLKSERHIFEWLKELIVRNDCERILSKRDFVKVNI